MKNKYWIVDSNNLTDIKDTFIGYAISEDGSFYLNEKPNNLDGTDCYTCIDSFPDKIRISQDFQEYKEFIIFIMKEEMYFQMDLKKQLIIL